MSGRARVTPGGVFRSDGSSFGPGLATAFIGNIEAITGSATLTRVYDVADIKLGEPVCQGDVIETMADGQVSIRFIDGTVLSLSNDTCLVLKHFVDDGAAASALFDVTRGSFAFVAGEMAKAGRLSIDTPVATMRGRTQTGGFGMLSMAALYFAIMDDAHAASSNAALFDDGVIDYKDLAHGVFDVVTKETIPRRFVVDDPGKTIILHRLGSSISADFVTNTPTQMAQLQAAQKDALQTFSLGLQQVPTNTGPSGSSTSPLLFPTTPINYTPPPSAPSPPSVLDNNIGGPASGDSHTPPPVPIIFIPPPPPIPQGPAIITEVPGHTADTTNPEQSGPPIIDSTTVTLAVAAATPGAPTFVWSGGLLTSSQQMTLALASKLTTTVDAGSVAFNFSADDKTFDFIAARETLTVTYNVAVTENNGTGSTQPVTFTVFGTNDRPVITAAATAGVTEQAHQTNQPAGITDTTSGTLSFTDVDLDDTHTVATTLASTVWNGTHGTIPAATLTDVANALSVSIASGADSTGTGSGTVNWAFTLADKDVDFLANGETLKLTYNVIVTDNSGADNGASAAQTVTITLTGTNDRPVITAAATAGVTEQAHQTNQPAGITDTTSGTLSFTDVDLDDTHTVATTLASTVWNGTHGTIPAATLTDVANALSVSIASGADSTGTGSGTVNWAFTLADKDVDFLANGETLKLTYNVIVTDNSGADNGASAAQTVTITLTGTNDRPVITAAATAGVTEQAHQTNQPAGITDTTSGTLSFTDVDLDDTHTVATTLASTVWNGTHGTIPAATLTDVANALSVSIASGADSTGTGSGTVNWAFTLADKDVDFLANGETLKLTYNVIVTDNSGADNGASAAQTVTITLTGTNDRPVITAAATAGVTEQAHQTNQPAGITDTTSGTLSFTDVDLDDTHTVATTLASTVWNGTHGTIPAATLTDVANALSVSIASGADSTGTGSGTVNWAFTLADKDVDFLANGETLKLTYNVIVTDNSGADNGASAAQTVTITLTGTNDRPVITAAATAGVTEQAHQTNQPAGITDTTSGTLSFTDVDLDDTHTVATTLASTVWNGTHGTIPAATLTDVANALSVSIASGADSTGTGSGTVNWAFTLADKDVDFLANGETLKLTYNVIVTDNSGADNGASAAQTVTITLTGTNDRPVITAAATAGVTEQAHQTNQPAGITDTTSGTLSFTDVDLDDTHTVATTLASTVWNGTHGTIPAATLTDVANALSVSIASGADSTGTGSGTVNWAFTLADKDVDFLANGETLKLTYNVIVTDNSGADNGASAAQTVTITLTGTNDRPVITAAATAGVTEQAHQTNQPAGITDTTSGTLSFTDVDLDDTHTVATTLASTVWNGTHGTIPAATLTDVANALSVSIASGADSTGTGSGTVNWAFTLADKDVDFLANGETLKLTYNVIVTDNSGADNGASAAQTVTITLTGTNDRPVITSSAQTGAVTELLGVTGSTTPDTANGALSFTDVDLDDTHTVATTLASTVWNGTHGTIPAATLTDVANALSVSIASGADSTGTGSGTVNWAFTLADKDVDFLANGETLKLTYNVIVTDNSGADNGASAAQTVTITLTGTNDRPVITSSAQTGAVTELLGVTGSTTPDTANGALSFTDVDLDDTHTVTVTGVTTSGITSGLPANATILGWLTLGSLTDTTGTGLGGSDGWTFSAQDKNFDYLAVHQTVTLTYTVQVNDHNGGIVTTPVTITINGNNEPPVITVPGAQTLDVNTATAITGVSVSEVGDTTGEIFTVKLTDTHGHLSADTTLTGGGGTITGSGTASLTISGTLSQVDSDLGTLKNTDATSGSDTIVVNVTDSYGVSAPQKTIAVTANQKNETSEPPTLSLGGTTATVTAGSTVTLPSISVHANDSDDTLTLTIAGLPMGATITDSVDSTVFSGSSFTLTGKEVGSTLTLHDGTNAGNFSLVVTANNTFPGETGSSASRTIAVTVNPVAPAGTAGSPINLALANPLTANGEPIAVTVTGVPSDWQLNQGINLGNGAWTIQSNDLSALTVVTAATYAGAIVLGVAESWTNADGSTAIATIADNVEAFAPGSPIFALSGDDNLTGSIADDLYVFAQPIGHDTIRAFDVAHDRIDLIGYGLASFGDIISHITTDAGGDAVITLADGQSITLDGIAAASLSANNFVFDQTPVTTNAGLMTIGDGAVLPLSGIVNNTGTIALDSAGNTTTLELIQSGITLQGGGQVVLSDSDGNLISGAFAGITLTNVDNTISGAGQLGDSQTTLVNEGTIVATGTHALLIDAGSNLITNSGTLEATGSGGLFVNGDISNSGLIWAHGGNISIDGAATGTGGALIDGGATLEFAAASSSNVAFGEGQSGTLVLDNPTAYTGSISGLDAAGPQGSDVIDLKGIAFDAGTSWAYADNAGSNTGGTLAIFETVNGTTTAVNNIAFANGDYTTANFLLTNDGHGGTLIAEPPTSAPVTQLMSVFVGGPGNDNFVFNVDQHLGASIISNFNTVADSIELDGYNSINNANIAAAITSNGADALHGDAVINLGHGDSVTVVGVTESYMQQHLNLIHLNSGVA